MTNHLDVHKPGERLATMDRKGGVRIYQVDADGKPKLIEITSINLPTKANGA
jgi:hypothetical protein